VYEQQFQSYSESGDFSSHPPLSSSDASNVVVDTHTTGMGILEAEEFGPGLPSSRTETSVPLGPSSVASPPPRQLAPVLSFRSVCASSNAPKKEAFPTLQAATATIKKSFPPLGSESSSLSKKSGGWGPAASSSSSRKSSSQPSSNDQSDVMSARQSSSSSREKKGKGKKVILFSIGGHRGSR